MSTDELIIKKARERLAVLKKSPVPSDVALLAQLTPSAHVVSQDYNAMTSAEQEEAVTHAKIILNQYYKLHGKKDLENAKKFFKMHPHHKYAGKEDGLKFSYLLESAKVYSDGSVKLGQIICRGIDLGQGVSGRVKYGMIENYSEPCVVKRQIVRKDELSTQKEVEYEAFINQDAMIAMGKLLKRPMFSGGDLSSYKYYQTMRYLGEPLQDVANKVDCDLQKKLMLAINLLLRVNDLHTGKAFISETPRVHLDIKPDNVMVSQSGMVNIIDFGFAREDSLYTPHKATEGTPYYMPCNLPLPNTRKEVYRSLVTTSSYFVDDKIATLRTIHHPNRRRGCAGIFTHEEFEALPNALKTLLDTRNIVALDRANWSLKLIAAVLISYKNNELGSTEEERGAKINSFLMKKSLQDEMVRRHEVEYALQVYSACPFELAYMQKDIVLELLRHHQVDSQYVLPATILFCLKQNQKAYSNNSDRIYAAYLRDQDSLESVLGRRLIECFQNEQLSLKDLDQEGMNHPVIAYAAYQADKTSLKYAGIGCVKTLLKHGCVDLQDVSEDHRKNVSVVLAAYHAMGMPALRYLEAGVLSLAHVEIEYCNDPHLVYHLVRQRPQELQYATKAALVKLIQGKTTGPKIDVNFASEACRNDPDVIYAISQYLPKKLAYVGQNGLIELMKQGRLTLGKLPSLHRNNPAIVKAAYEFDKTSLKYAERGCLLALLKEGQVDLRYASDIHRNQVQVVWEAFLTSGPLVLAHAGDLALVALLNNGQIRPEDLSEAQRTKGAVAFFCLRKQTYEQVSQLARTLHHELSLILKAHMTLIRERGWLDSEDDVALDQHIILNTTFRIEGLALHPDLPEMLVCYRRIHAFLREWEGMTELARHTRSEGMYSSCRNPQKLCNNIVRVFHDTEGSLKDPLWIKRFQAWGSTLKKQISEPLASSSASFRLFRPKTTEGTTGVRDKRHSLSPAGL